MAAGYRKRNRVHAVPEGVDAEMAAAMGWYVNAVCGYRWVPEKFGDECAGIKKCEECYPEPRKPKGGPRGPRFTSRQTDPIPHYVYRHYDDTGRLIYVGCSNNPIRRNAGHRSNAWWYEQVHTTRLIVFPNRAKALAQERRAIATEMPRWNVKGKWAYRTAELWGADDYIDFRFAIVQAIETTHGVYGANTRVLLEQVDQELMEKFGVTAINRRPA